MKNSTWTIAETKAKFSELVITKNGRKAVVVVSAEESEKKAHHPGNLAEFFAESPLRGSGLETLRTKDGPRDADL